ncbi:MAG: PEP/pyruvate-binding domain-containing protein, partial [Pseudomonadota bacterium]
MLEIFSALKSWKLRKGKPSNDKLSEIFQVKYEHFKELLNSNTELSKIIADIEEKLQGHQVFGMSYVRSQAVQAVFYTLRMVKSLDALSGHKYPQLFNVLENLNSRIKEELEKKKQSPVTELILPYPQITKEMVDWVGGKSANLGEILNRANLPIPEGFAITTRAYDLFFTGNDLVDEINKRKMELNPNDLETVTLVSEEIQKLILSAPVPPELSEAILSAYDQMVERIREENLADYSLQVSMRSSAIGEDSELSYAGQYLSVLNVPREKLIQTYKYVIASLFTPRAISYRLNKGIRDEDIAM